MCVCEVLHSVSVRESNKMRESIMGSKMYRCRGGEERRESESVKRGVR